VVRKKNALFEAGLGVTQLLLDPLARRDVNPHADQLRLAVNLRRQAGEKIRDAPAILGDKIRFRFRRAVVKNLANPFRQQRLIRAGKKVERTEAGEFGGSVAGDPLKIFVPAPEAQVFIVAIEHAR